MTQNAKVIKVEKGHTFVMVKRQSACSGNCKDCSGCCEKPVICEAENNVCAKEGDDVVIYSDTKKTLFLAFKLYILPIFIFIAALALYEAKAMSTLILTAFILIIILMWIFIIKKSKTPKKIILEVLPTND